VAAEKPRRPTIDDVAALAGVSSAAVSFAVNGRPGVGDETRRRILAAADERGWRPSASARALTEARARAIGLLLARSVDQLEVDPFFVRFLAGVERALARSDHDLVLRVAERVELGLYERLAAAGRVDGFLLCDVEVDDPRFALLEAAGLPVVVAGHPVSPCPFPAIETEHAAGMALVVEHLVALGHERIAFVGGPAHYEHVQARLVTFRAALAAAGLRPGPITHDAFDFEPGVTAVVHTSDVLAMATLGAARERGATLSITGFDDSPLAALASPALTSVRIDYAAFGESAAAQLVAALRKDEPPVYVAAPPELIVRESTGPAPR
jgi:LacI family transcriptional regulator, repressor for deo operon, udp, cdd, tsx, nupC, and nupG